ncbi:DNA helicase-2 / ATP-dependent DNA helicase PcrA [Salinibacillus kushneri]|uniref:DNA 3'-5' helicase n=1 Tax=Salinibacillus kushneri TaxID=237682 RepID=A0A1H9Z5L4_9BACI|nr:ATP-dependent helicase [Salinibacillus kushneri]SES76837.1 DNA helicase-2 / ATP-dependent DNA helicase PcrA [Salinibacillus kushneri]
MTRGNLFFNRKNAELGVSLNEVQRQAVLRTDGPLLLLASPGSGKTTTIIMRIGYLIEAKGAIPSRIKAVTFSKAAANDMKERFQQFFPYLPPVDFSTIHSLAFQVVREYFYQKGTTYQLIEGEGKLNKKRILRGIFQSIHNEMITDDQLEELITYISYIKNRLIPEEKWASVGCNVPKAGEIMKQYEAYKTSFPDRLFVDYDDMLTIANRLLKTEQKLRIKYQQKYDYVLTDESQDTSLVQHSIIEKLVGKHHNLCVVADDDQSIYMWRAAEPQYLLDFKKVYPDATVLKMEQNYRSSKEIVNIANQFIKRNKNRYDKQMFTENPAKNQVQLTTLQDFREQSDYLVDNISHLENYRDVAILYRNHSSSIPLIDAFERARIPFYMKDPDNRFFSHWIVKDVLNFMRLAFDIRRTDIFERVYGKFHWYLSKFHMEDLKRIQNGEPVFDNLLNYTNFKDFQKIKIKKGKEIFIEMKTMNPAQAIRTIRKDLGYDDVLKDMSKRLGFNKDHLLDILNTLEEISKSVASVAEFGKRIKHLDALMASSKCNKHENAVTFSTFHSAKGLEYPKVYMIDLIDGVIPAQSDLERAKEGVYEPLEEAVRLFYVGMTRAQEYLELLTHQRKYGKKMRISRFYEDVRRIIHPSKVIEQTEEKVPIQRRTSRKSKVPVNPNAIQNIDGLQKGDLVKHRVFGSGEIISCDDGIIEIRFPKFSKQLSVKKCLEIGLLEKV